MPSFRQRPLTWLFLIATACVDLTMFVVNPEARWFNQLLDGQLLLVGGWLVLGQAHRLAKAGAVEAAIFAITAPDFAATPRSQLTAQYVLGTAIFLVVAAACCTFVWRRFFTWLAPAADPPVQRTWQFPMIELFGWMIVVAVAATMLRRADFEYLREISVAAPCFTLAVAAAFLMTMPIHFAYSDQRLKPSAVALSILGVWACGWYMRFGPVQVQDMVGGPYYTFIWAIIAGSEIRRQRQAGNARPTNVKSPSDAELPNVPG